MRSLPRAPRRPPIAALSRPFFAASLPRARGTGR